MSIAYTSRSFNSTRNLKICKFFKDTTPEYTLSFGTSVRSPFAQILALMPNIMFHYIHKMHLDLLIFSSQTLSNWLLILVENNRRSRCNWYMHSSMMADMRQDYVPMAIWLMCPMKVSIQELSHQEIFVLSLYNAL